MEVRKGGEWGGEKVWVKGDSGERTKEGLGLVNGRQSGKLERLLS